MTINEITQKEIWESFLLNCQEKTFLNSWNWGEFQSAQGGKIWRLGIFDGDELISVALVIKTAAKRGTFLLIPHGPNIKANNRNQKDKILEILIEELKKIAIKERVDFIRISPILPARNASHSDAGGERNEEIFTKLGFRRAPIHSHPESSWKLDIRPTEEELLMGMRKTTRYLIRQAIKNPEIKIFQSQKLEDIKTFDNLQQEVVKSQQFIPFSLDYLEKEFNIFNLDNQVSIFFGEYQGKIIGSAFVLFWSGIGFYHHAALLPEYHKVPVAYLIQWEAIKETKRRGCELYDFWGYINPQIYPKHPWAGPTLFKMGFGGKPYEYVLTQDFPLSFKYWLTYIFEKIRKLKRGL